MRQVNNPLRRWGVTAAVAALVLAGAGIVGTQFASAADVGTTAASAGCGKAPTLTSGSKTIRSGNQNRSYILDIPAKYDRNHPYRLIFGMHWLNGTASNVASGDADGAAWAFYGQKQLSNGSTIFVAPQGIDNGWANTGNRDVTLVDDIIKLVESDLCIDTSLVFSMGWSYGGSMSYALACARPTVFRAVVAYSGANLSGCSGGTQPVAYFGIHGIYDSVLNISMGRSLRDTFVRNNGCTAQNPREPSRGSLTHVTTAYAGCRAGYPVQWAAFDGDHTPMPVDGSTATSGTRTWTSAEVNKFLAQFQSTQPSSSPTNTPTSIPTSTPSSTPSSTPTSIPTSTPTSSPSGTSNCSVGYLVNAWSTGLTASITITNTGNTAINGWSLGFTLPSGQVITSGWNATYSPNSGAITATGASYNGNIPAHGSISIGFQASHTGNPAKPTAFTLNGAACTTV